MTFDEFSKTGMADLLLLINRQEEKLRIAEEALGSIGRNTCCDMCQEAAFVAHEALAKLRGESK